MHIARLVIETGQSMVSLELHPRLTVVAGVEPPVRDILATELVGGLAGTRSGAHLEVVTQARRRLTVFRPSGSTHRIVDTGSGEDHSDEFRNDLGRLNVLDHLGVDSGRALETLYLDRDGLTPNSDADAAISRLAEIDQGRLWSAAARVRVTDEELQTISSSIDDSVEDAEAVAQIERRHQSLESAVAQQQVLQRQIRMVAGVSLLCTILLYVLNDQIVWPLVALTVGLVLFMLGHRIRVDRAQRSETSALKAAGADSYLGFVAKRVDTMMTGTEQQRRLAAVADDHRTAAIAWTRLAGNVSVDWAFAHHDEIDATARLRRQLRTMGHASSQAPELDPESAALAHSLILAMGRLRKMGRSNEGMPLILDDPLEDVPEAMRPTILELIARTAGSPQVILLTSSASVADWARVEALTGEVALVEPHTSAAPSQAAHLAG